MARARTLHPTATDTSSSTAGGPPAGGDSPTARRLREAVLEDRRRTIEAIRRFNPTATPTFLASFKTGPLKEYLEHLRHARHKHVRLGGWLQERSQRLALRRRQAERSAA